MANMATPYPARKVNGAAFAAAVSSVLLWVLRERLGWQLPITLEPAIVAIVTFVVGYFIPPADRDTLDSDVALPLPPTKEAG
ncbi:hypothetical protein J7443_23490 [Tropicibacter sp. R15_0]|uniref:hypothetical protein n=1 Tax=Tropicibacter sp. R15_0 TaxID=2821101 RepID=UPI001ADC81B9|nr:hypothetical protein [Tropicibacter sp. R15_0]MBO9468210.1 hypothetical protein [Tropicibacter sp. R15_0]